MSNFPLTRSTAVGIVLAATAAFAQPSPIVIDWSKDRPLRRADFQGTVGAERTIAARSLTGIDASWECSGDWLRANIRAVFYADESWWRGAPVNGANAAMTDAQLLQHEQTHFDIAETVARKLRTHIYNAYQVCRRPGGTVPLQAIVSDYQLELSQEQARYDHETAFGRDPRMQFTWTSRISKALEGR